MTWSSWLTVVMPSYCGEQWVGTALQSIANDASQGVEVLLIDSSPSAATLDVARTYSDRLNLRTFECRDLTSWQAKTNFGVQIAASNHICWLGVDDVWLAGRAAAVRSWIEVAFLAPLHLAPAIIINKAGEKLGIWRCPLVANSKLQSGMVMERLLVQNFIAAPAPIFRKDAWLACGGLDEKLWYTADWDMWLKLAASGSVYYHDILTVGFRIHRGSLTVSGSRDADAFEQQMQIVLDRHLRKLGNQSKGLERIARASIAVNAALASASAGDGGGLLRAACRVLGLGPAGFHRYMRYSRILERVTPRVRAKLTGAF